MKNKIQTVCVLVLALATLIISGCASTSGGGYSLKQTRDDISWAMTRYNNRLPTGFITPTEQQGVNAAYAAYLQAYNEAVQQANSNLDSPTPANVSQLANSLLSTLNSL